MIEYKVTRKDNNWVQLPRTKILEIKDLDDQFVPSHLIARINGKVYDHTCPEFINALKQEAMWVKLKQW